MNSKCDNFYYPNKQQKRKHHSIEEKLEIVKEAERNPLKSKAELAKHFNLPESTLKGILYKKTEIKDAASKCAVKRSKIQPYRFAELESILIKWFNEMRSLNLPVSSITMKEKACEIAHMLDIPYFSASCGWLDKFKKRNRLLLCHLGGESSFVHSEDVQPWQNHLQSLCEEYDPKDIFNADESGLFFNLLPNQTKAYSSEICHDGKLNKDRLTMLLACNADGSEKLSILVIGKSESPHCFKNVKCLPCDYDSSRKAWMTSGLYQQFLYKLDAEMVQQNRKIILFIDECPVHTSDIPALQNVRLLFFPADSTNVVQPLEQGVVRCVKSRYRSLLIKKLIMHQENKECPKKITILDAMHLLRSAWEGVSSATIANCFNKSGIVGNPTEMESPGTDEVYQKEITEEEWALVSDGSVTLDEFIDVDAKVVTCELRDVDQIIDEVRNNFGKEDKSSDDGDEEDVVPPSVGDALKSLSTLHKFMTMYEVEDDVFTHLNRIGEEIWKMRQKQRQVL